MFLGISDMTTIFFIAYTVLLLILLAWILYLRGKMLSKSKNNSLVSSDQIVNQQDYSSIRLKYKELQAENDELSKVISQLQFEKSRLTDIYEKAKQRAEESDILKSNFLANMSHEIRTPMNGILGFVQLLKGEDSAEKRDRYIDIVYHNGMMLVNLIDDIIDISKIDAGQLAINQSECNLDDLMFDVYTFFNEVKFKQEKEHINIRLLNLNDDESNILYTDGQRLRQVLVNLLGNALKFTDKGSVEFGYVNNHKENKIQFFVRDSGIGIPEDKRDIIFERFRQVQEGSTRKYGGTGIGLYISRNIINLLGGDIWFESKVGEGTTFYFSIPYIEKRYQESGSMLFSTTVPEYNWSGKNILIAEDVEVNYRYLSTILADTKANVLWAKNGQEVIEKTFNGSNVDIILMDIQMPLMDGYEATLAIRKYNPTLPIIAQTAYALPHDNIKCFEVGCNDYISKPINANLLKQKIDTLLNVYVKNS